MGFKNTLEIITKDIEELEKIVSNLQNYSRIPKIELDLALGKMQNIYELLLMIRDSESDLYEISGSVASPAQADTGNERVQEKKVPETVDNGPEPKNNDPVEFIDQKEPEVQEPTKKSASQGDQKEITPVDNPRKEGGEKTNKPTKERILAEKYEKSGDFVNEKIGVGKIGKDLSSKIQSTPIQSISGSLGINDKFYFIRELFNGNADNFRSVMLTLDEASNFNEAYNFILNNYDWDMDSETVQQLLNLIRRKFINTTNE